MSIGRCDVRPSPSHTFGGSFGINILALSAAPRFCHATSATISRMGSHVLAPFSAAPEAKRYVQPHTAGWSTCAFSFPTSAPGPPNPTLPSSVSLRARFQRHAIRFSGMVSRKHGNAPELVSRPRCSIWSARCRRFAPSLFNDGELRSRRPRSQPHAATRGQMR